MKPAPFRYADPGTLVAVVGWHVARALAPAEMKEAIYKEGGYSGGTGPALGHAGAHEVSADPSSVDEVTGDEARLRRHDTPGAPGR